ncbi:hypothetical protein HW132_26790 [Brasilonema sp. CT11]|nr:hypothetical protein [Brasilonema sp. CT11]
MATITLTKFHKLVGWGGHFHAGVPEPLRWGASTTGGFPSVVLVSGFPDLKHVASR